MRNSEHEISTIDFKSTSTLCMQFPSDGPAESRPSYTEVAWRSYCPDVFRILQDYGKVDFDDYTASICSHHTVRQVLAPGKNGSLLHLSNDHRFVLQKITKYEMKVFLDKLPSYYRYVRENKSTLLTKYYGLHSVKQAKGQKVYFVVMGNIFRSDLHIHKHFNLKSFSQCFNVNNESTALDELDIIFHLDTSTRNQILVQLERDCNFLGDMGFVDYSLLLGIHLSTPSPKESLKRVPLIRSQPTNRSPSNKAESFSNTSSTPPVSLSNGSSSPEHSTGTEYGSPDGDCASSQVCDQQSSSQVFDPQSSSQDCHPLNDQDQDSSSADNLQSPLYVTPTEDKLGVETAACAVRRNAVPTRKGKEKNVKLFFEITNIHHQYNLAKRVENVFKSLQTDSGPVGNPKVYSNRFQDFICEIFPEEDSKGFP